MTNNTSIGWYLNTSGQGNNPNFGGTFPQNTWMHVAATYDATTSRIYLNGTQVASTPRTGPLPTVNTPLIIGGNANNATPNTAQDLFTVSSLEDFGPGVLEVLAPLVGW